MPKPFADPNISTFTSFFEHVNLITDGLAIPGLLLTSFIVIFMICYRNPEYEIPGCFLIAATGTLIFALLFWAAGLIAGKILVICLVILIGVALYNELSKR